MIFNNSKTQKKRRERKRTFKLAELCSKMDFISPKPKLESQNNFWVVFIRLMGVRDHEITRS